MNKILFMFCGKLCVNGGKGVKISATFRLDIVGQKGYHRPQVHKHCDEKEEYLRRIFREPSVGARWQSETEKGALEQFFTKEG